MEVESSGEELTLQGFMAVVKKVEWKHGCQQSKNSNGKKKKKVAIASATDNSAVVPIEQERYIWRCFSKCTTKRERKEMLKMVLQHIKNVTASQAPAQLIDWTQMSPPKLSREAFEEIGVDAAHTSTANMEDSPIVNGKEEEKEEEEEEEGDSTKHKSLKDMNIIRALVKRVKTCIAAAMSTASFDALPLQGTTMEDEEGANTQTDQLGDEDEEDIEAMKVKVIGTSTVLEKDYLRLTRHPRASDVRSLATLHLSFAMLKEKASLAYSQPADVKQEESTKLLDGQYFHSQFRSLRQDLHVQGILTDFTVEVFEYNARISLVFGDFPEYHRCLSQLIWMYRSMSASERERRHSFREFVYYRLIENIFEDKRDELLACLQEINEDSLLTSPEFAAAMLFQRALEIGNVHGFFARIKQTKDFSRYIMQRSIEKWQRWGLKILCKAYGPTLMDVEIVRVSFALADLQQTEEVLRALGTVLEGGADQLKVRVKETLAVLSS